MKNRRAIFWLLFALLLSIGAHVLLSYKFGVSAALMQRTTLLEQSLAKPVRISIVRPGRPETVLAYANSWRLVEPYPASVDERAVLKLLDLLATVEIQDNLTEHAMQSLGRTLDDFGLGAEKALKITLQASDSSSTTIMLGLQTPASDGVYAAVEGEDAVYVVSSAVFKAADLDAGAFRRRTLVPENAGSVASFDLKRGAGAFMRFTRDGDSWRMTEPRRTAASAMKIRKMLGLIAAAEAVDFVWPVGARGESATATVSLLAGYGLDPESAVTLTMKCADGSDQQVSFGKEAKDGQVYALIQNGGAIATVSGKLKDQALAGVAEFTDSRLFPFDPSSAVRVSISDGPVTYLLAKEDGGAWRLDSPVAAPTDPATVDSLFSKIFSLTSADLAPSGAPEDWSVGITVMQSQGAASEPMPVLKYAVLGDVRLEDLRSREIFKIDPSAVKRLVVSGVRGKTPTAVIYDKDRRAWNVEKSPVGGSVNVQAVEAAISALNPLLADGIVKLKVSPSDLRSFGLEDPRFTVAVDQDRDDALRRNILIGDALESGGVFATLGATDAVFILPERTVRRLEAPFVIAK